MSPTAKPTLEEIDLTDASVWEKGTPHTWFAVLRREDPVHWYPESDGRRFWVVTTHENVRRISPSPGDCSRRRPTRRSRPWSR